MARTPSTEDVYEGDGTTAVFQFHFPFQDASDVFVSVDDVNVSFTILPGSIAQVQLTVPPAAGTTVKVYRSTLAIVPKHLFAGGVPFLPRYVDENNRQLLYATQEAINDTAVTAAEALVVAEEAKQIAQDAEDKIDGAIIDSSYQLRVDLANPAIGAALVGNGIQVVDTVAALRALAASYPRRNARTLGYYTPGDGGGGDFFADTADTTTTDNGGSVIVAADGTRWKLTQRSEWSVRQFGARGDGTGDDTAAIQAAINALPLRGGTVLVGDGRFNITATITIGDGNGGTTPSTRTGVRLRGNGAGFATSGTPVPTILQWTGPNGSSAPMIRVAGNTSDVDVSDMLLYCNGQAAGIACNSFSGCKLERIKVMFPRTVGLNISGGAAPTGNYNVFNRVSQVHVALNVTSAIGLYMDGVYAANNDTWITSFDLCRFEAVSGGTNAVCAWFKFVDSCTFTRCHFESNNISGAIGAIFDATGNNDFPAGLGFYDCSVRTHVVYEDASHFIRKNYFYGFGTYDNEVVPTHANLVGITDTGAVFGRFLFGEAWTVYTPTVTAASGTITTVAAAGRYRQVGRTVFFTVDLFITTNGTGAQAVRITLPPLGNSGPKECYFTGRNNTAGGALVGIVQANTNTAVIRKYDDSYPGANGTTLAVSGFYELA